MASFMIADLRMVVENFREKPISKTLAVSLHLKDCIKRGTSACYRRLG
jgi:hypothetical protein